MMFEQNLKFLKEIPTVKVSDVAPSVLEVNLKGLSYDTILKIFKSIYHLGSQFNRNIPETVFMHYVNQYLAYTRGFDPMFYQTLWVDVDVETQDALVYQVGNSESIGFLLESIMWGMNIYATPEFLKSSITNLSRIGNKSGTPVVSSPFHVTACGDEETDTQDYESFMLVRDFPYACFNFDGHYLDYDEYLGSLKSKRRNALVSAQGRGYTHEVLTSDVRFSGDLLLKQASELTRNRFDAFSDYRHSMGQLIYALSPWDLRESADNFVGLAVIQRSGDEIISITIAHVSDTYPSKIISHTSRSGFKDVGASATANLINYIADVNQTNNLGFKIDNLNVCCETYVGVNLTGSYTQYLRHACNAESYETFDFISVVDKDLSTTLKPPFFNAIENIWVH